MKKIILILTILLFLANVSAQSLEINLISYDSELGNARIQIVNNANTDLHNLKMKIDNAAEINIADTFRSGLSFSTFQLISPGSHEITVTSKEGITLTKKLYFSPSEKQIEQQVEQQKQLIEQKKSQQQPLTTKIKGNNKYIYAILTIIAIVIFYIIYKRLKR